VTEVEYSDEFGIWWEDLAKPSRKVSLTRWACSSGRVPIADRIYDEHLEQLRRAGLIWIAGF